MWDMEERGRIRSVLQGYMQAHQIGAPRLSGLISKANPRNPEVTLKTLQRFLAGHMRTNDAFVGMCAKFAETCPAISPVESFAAALSAFYGGTDLEWLPGEYLSMSGQDFEDRNSGKATIRGSAGAWTIVERRGADIYEGAIVKTETGFVASLKHRAYGAPRTFVVQHSPAQDAFERLVGVGSGVDFLQGTTVGSMMRGGEPKVFTILISEKAKS